MKHRKDKLLIALGGLFLAIAIIPPAVYNRFPMTTISLLMFIAALITLPIGLGLKLLQKGGVKIAVVQWILATAALILLFLGLNPLWAGSMGTFYLQFWAFGLVLTGTAVMIAFLYNRQAGRVPSNYEDDLG